jgi:hypothetical protein
MNNHIYIIIVTDEYESVPKVMSFTCFEAFRHNLMHTCNTEWIPEFGLCFLHKDHWKAIASTITSSYNVIRTTSNFENMRTAIEHMRGEQSAGCKQIYLKRHTHGINNELT